MLPGSKVARAKAVYDRKCLQESFHVSDKQFCRRSLACHANRTQIALLGSSVEGERKLGKDHSVDSSRNLGKLADLGNNPVEEELGDQPGNNDEVGDHNGGNRTNHEFGILY